VVGAIEVEVMTADDGGELLIGPRHLLAQIQHGNDLGFADHRPFFAAAIDPRGLSVQNPVNKIANDIGFFRR